MRLGALFVAVCITVIAASAGAMVYFVYGFSGADAILVAIVALAALALYNLVSTRMDIRSVVGPQLTELSRGGADMARQLAELGRRLAAVESKLERNLAKGEATMEPLAVEISELGALLDQLAETVALHETQLAELELAKPAFAAPAEPAPVRAQPAKSKAAEFLPAKPALAKPEFAKLEPLQAEPSRAEPSRTEPLGAAPASTADAAEGAESLAFRAAIQAVFAAEPAPAPSAATAPAAAIAPAAATTPAASETVVAMPVAATAAPPAAVPTRPVPPAPVATAHAPQADKSAGREMQAAIRSAIEANRIDLHLQPIVTLPQRKVRFYEAMSRLRTQSGDVVLAAEFISQAEAGGLMPKIDNLVVFRCVQVLRRLLLKNREVGVFCNLSVATLTDAVVFPQLLEFLDANRAIAPSLVLEFTQSGLRGAGPIETESLAALRACGFHFSMDNVTDLRLEPRELASRGFRFVKLRANLILNRSGIAADIHPGDLPDLLGRFGIDLIAEKIESEGSVVDLLDYDVKFGQGFLFSPPRPVRAEALQGITDRNDVVARESAASDPGGGAGRTEIKEPRATAPEPKGLRSAGLTRLVRRV
jgi:cyclic-di-GMP phosphodiesterase, flagellum assembly factor TipF